MSNYLFAILIITMITFAIAFRQEIYTSGKAGYGAQFSLSATGVPKLLDMKDIVTCSQADEYLMCISSNGNLYTLGAPAFGYYGGMGLGDLSPAAVPTKILTGVKQVGCSQYHTIVLFQNGSIALFGRNSEGQLGIGSKDDNPHPTPVFLADVNDAVSVAVTGQTSYYVSSSGTVWSWGSNAGNCVLGRDCGTSSVFVPGQIPGFSNITTITTGHQSIHVCMLDSAGIPYCWGRNDFGQLGRGIYGGIVNPPFQGDPAPPIGLEFPIVQVSVGFHHTMFLDSKNRLYTNGLNDKGQLGAAVPDYSRCHTPFLIPTTDKTIISIKAGFKSSFYIDDAGRAYATGFNQYLQLGTIGSNADLSSFTLIGSTLQVPVTFVSNGGSPSNLEPFLPGNSAFGPYSTVLGNLKTVFYHGELGSQVKPTLSLLEPQYTGVTTGVFASWAVSETGQVIAAGAQDLGLNSGATTQFFPVVNSNFAGKKIIRVVGGIHVFFITDTFEVYSIRGGCLPSDLPTTVPHLITGFDRIIEIDTQSGSTMILAQNGTVYGCGHNWSGQLGLNHILDQKTPAPLPFEGPVQMIQCGETHSMILTNDSEIWTTGSNSGGALGTNDTLDSNILVRVPPFTTSKVIQIVASYHASFVLTMDNKLYSWGLNPNGNLGFSPDPGPLPVPRPMPTLVPLGITVSKMWAKGSQGESATYLQTIDSKLYVCGRSFGVLGDGDYKSIYPPVMIPGMEAVVHVASGVLGFLNTFFLTKCPDGRAGPACQYPVCFGISANSFSVCSSQGTCTATDTCVCTPPSSGARCQVQDFVWIGPVTGETWGNFYNWVIKKGETTIPATFAPGANEENVIFDSSVPLYTINVGASVTGLGTMNLVTSLTLVFTASNIEFSGSSFSISAPNTFKTTYSDALLSDGVSDSPSSSTINGISIKFNTFTVSDQVEIVFGNKFIYKLDFLVIKPGGVIKHDGSSGSLTSTKIMNDGTYLIDSKVNSVSITADTFVNSKLLEVNGNNNIRFLVKSFQAVVGSFFYIKNAPIVMESNSLNISNGYFYPTGSIQTPNLIYSSIDGLFGLLPLDLWTKGLRLDVIGNATFTSQSSMLFSVSGNTVNANDFLNVTGALIINSLLTIRTTLGFAPDVGQQFPMFSSQKFEVTRENVNLIGAPFKNVEYLPNGDLRVIFSVGGAQDAGYQCTYLGFQKNLEINQFDLQQRTRLSFTIPQTPLNCTLIGIEFENFYVVIDQVKGTATPIVGKIILGTASLSKTIFDIGPEYYTITLLVSQNILLNQSTIYYHEINTNCPGAMLNHSEKFDFKIRTANADKIDCSNLIQPSRAEIYSYGGFGVMMGIYLITFILSIICIRKRPMNSRGISPFLTLFFLFVQLLMEIRNYFVIPVFQGSLCLYLALGYYPLQIIVFVMIFLYFVRYFAVINLNSNKTNLYARMQSGTKLQAIDVFKNRFLKVLASNWFAFIFIVIAYVVITIIFMLVFAGYGFICRFDTLIGIKIISNIILMAVYALTVASLIFDVIGNAKLVFVTCKWWKYVVNSDPYWFRVQIVIFIPFMIAAFAVEIYDLVSSTTYLLIVTHFKAKIIIGTIFAQLLLILDVLFPLVITYITWFTSCFQKKKKDSVFDRCITEEPLMKLFKAFCESEFSVENWLAMMDIRKFAAEKDSEERKRMAKALYETYFNGAESIMELNVQLGPRKILKEKIAKDEVPTDLFDVLMGGVTANLTDTYCRFASSQELKKYLENEKQQEMLVSGQ